MIRLIATIALLSGLAACGTDGPPHRPDATPGISLTGEAQIALRNDDL